jgi:hypothetical protein
MTRPARRALKSSLAGAYRHGTSEGALGDSTRAVVRPATTAATTQLPHKKFATSFLGGKNHRSHAQYALNLIKIGSDCELAGVARIGSRFQYVLDETFFRQTVKEYFG